ncbi:argininosuccinate synthase [Methanohalophilus portucalensis]|uniref:Argininosuccinate synthase n=2 Tax=Methanohalophilus portucalensis TaxID=39664 RepID=A0A1L9C6W0_9EURY|nr:argininosuccinate synthase [Methanohalophilus portucalensis]ATU08821.1 argininosuccinate synthase [Methanohalophilus portucalensis]OJH50214.1 argininosuccinate synthase [Methanohalophilus portucalensis FDF-1]RNI11334.1 argininosuccinate synthase [Methanohalophilus portucalensis FDF-1]SMH27543.1 argininosuccinate synthase [Methanohalophilus portucalensis FDF-1]
MVKKAVLAYSGGLDTSICVPLLKEKYDCDEVITVAVDVGQPREDVKEATEKAQNISDLHFTLDVREEFVNDYIFPLIKANGDYEGYVMGTSIARPLIAKKVVEIAEKEGATMLAHGCTGKGNDQLRFEAVFRLTDMDVVAPMRDMNLTREWEIEYAKNHGIPVSVTSSKPWSIDENIWSRSIEGGKLEDPGYIPPEDIYNWTVDPAQAPDAQTIEIGFEAGVPVSLDGKTMEGVTLIEEMNRIAGSHGVGRTDMIEDRVLGLKARENYEHPAATVLLTAHRDLEKLVLTRSELKFKAMVDAEWSELAYLGLVDEPLYEDLNAFIDSTQQRVTGTVTVKLYKGNVYIMARTSPNGLYSEDLVSFDSKVIDQQDAEGFSKYHGFQARLYRRFVANK